MSLSSQSSRNDALAKLFMDSIYLRLMQTAMIWIGPFVFSKKCHSPMQTTTCSVEFVLLIAFLCFWWHAIFANLTQESSHFAVSMSAALRLRRSDSGLWCWWLAYHLRAKQLLMHNNVCWAPWSKISHQMSSTRVSLQSLQNSQSTHMLKTIAC